MPLLNDFVNTAPRDTAGSRALAGFDFQINWALCLLINLYYAGKEFLLVLDYHDDVVLMDSESRPRKIHFFQAKTTSSQWNTAALADQETSATLSVIGKLYDHRIRFQRQNSTINLVVTSTFGRDIFTAAPLLDPESSCQRDPERPWLPCVRRAIPFNKINTPASKKLVASIKRSHGLSRKPNTKDIWFIETHISFEMNERAAKAEVMDLLDGLGCGYQSGAFYKTLRDSLRRRCSATGQMHTLDELKRKKSITKSEFCRILSRLTPLPLSDPSWEWIRSQLSAIGYTYGQINRLMGSLKRYHIDRITFRNVPMERIKTRARAIMDQLIQDGVDNLGTYLNQAIFLFGPITSPYDEDYIRAIFLLERHDAQQ